MTTSCAVKEFILPSTAHIEMAITTARELNPNADGRPSPLVIRIYELKTLEEFNNADFFTMYENETQALGKTMLAKVEYEFKPGERKNIQREANQQTRYLGILAAYRDIDNAQWRAVATIPEKTTSKFNLHLGSLGLSLTTLK